MTNIASENRTSLNHVSARKSKCDELDLRDTNKISNVLTRSKD